MRLTHLTLKRVRFLFLYALLLVFISLLFFPPSLRAAVLVLDDFSDGADGNLLGQGEAVSGLVGGSASMALVSTVTAGNQGFARQFSYIITPGGSTAQYDSIFTPQNLTPYRYVSFYVRGAVGLEKLFAEMDDGTNYPQTRIDNFFTNGMTKNFQKVVISTEAFYNPNMNWNSGTGAFHFLATNAMTAVDGQIYIDDIRFGDKPPSPVWVDNFDDGSDPTITGKFAGYYIDNDGAASSSTVRGSYDNGVAYGGAGFSYKVDFSSGSSTQYGVYLIQFATSDLTGTDSLVFHVAGDAASAGTDVGIGLKDMFSTESVLLLNNTYLPGGISNGTFGEAKIPISDFTSAVPALDPAHILAFEVWFQKPGLATTIGSATMYFDNIRFVDTSTPTAPSSFQANGSAVFTGMVITTAASLSVTADAGGSDATLEEVRFEHDGLCLELVAPGPSAGDELPAPGCGLGHPGERLLRRAVHGPACDGGFTAGGRGRSGLCVIHHSFPLHRGPTARDHIFHQLGGL